MGSAHSRRKPGASVVNVARLTFGANVPPPKAGYFILSLKPDKIKVVNAEAGVMRLLTTVIKKHVEIVKEGWDRQSWSRNFSETKVDLKCYTTINTIQFQSSTTLGQDLLYSDPEQA